MELNLILAPGDPQDYADRIDEALVGVMVADGPNLAPLGRRQVDGALTETIWNDEEDGHANVRFMNDSEIPAQWVALEADDSALLQTLVQAVRDLLPVQDWETLRDAASSQAPGALSRLALTHDARLADELTPLVRKALASASAGQREEAAMAAHLAAVPGTLGALRGALEREPDSGVKLMLEHAIATVEAAASKQAPT